MLILRFTIDNKLNTMKIGSKLKLLVPCNVLFALALILPAFSYETTSKNYIAGWFAFVMGWFPAIFGALGAIQGNGDYFGTISWFANPVLFIAWVLLACNSFKQSQATSAIALLLSLLFIAANRIPVPDNNTMENIKLTYGYFFWLASIATTWVIAFLANHKH